MKKLQIPDSKFKDQSMVFPGLFPWLFLLLTLSFELLSLALSAQLSFTRYESIPVVENNDTFQNAWAGGINSALFSEIDLDSDGRKDIFFFEKDGFTVRTFKNDGARYQYAPEYQQAFPSMRVFALLADYNCDGKEDIFTSAPGGMAVYKNISTPLGGLDFTLMTSILNADYNPGFYNLYVAATDIPALSDIDGDGDTDILSFENNGSYVRYFKNLSLESFGNCDSLKFQISDACWGKFYEHPNNNSVVFPVSCKAASFDPGAEGVKHTGSTLLAINMDGDTDKDLLLGDVSFKNMVGLTNGGDSLTAAVTAQDITYPSNTTAVNLLFPAGFYFDADNDSLNDLIVTPNTAVATENFTSVWFYKNSGTNDSPVLNFQKNNFLQETMIDLGSGCNPSFFDYNADGLKDMVVGNYGYYNSITGMYEGRLALFENTGTAAAPAFKLVTRDYANVSAEKKNALYPAFGDIDNDGDEDMFVGEYDGGLLFYENIAGAGDTADFILKSIKYKSIDAGHFAAPQVADLNRDGLPDLLVGEQDGTLNYFQNTGTLTAPDFSNVPTIDTLGGIDVEPACCTGYNVPFLFEDSAGNYSLLAGSQRGTIYYYINIDGNLNGNFMLTDSINTGEFRIGISMADIDNDGKNEIAVGSYPGGMHILKSSFSLGEKEQSFSDYRFRIFPNPSNGTFIIQRPPDEGEIDIKIYDVFGKAVFQAERSTPGSEINITTLSSGIYFLKIYSGKNIYVKKIVKV